MRRAFGAFVVVLLVAGCSGSGSGAARQPNGPSHPVVGNPLELVGAWHVTGAGEQAGTSLILGSQLILFRSCGELFGSWNADEYGDFIGAATGGSQRCFLGRHEDSDVAWLRQAVGFRIVGLGRILVDASNKVVARLSPGAHPTAGSDVAPSEASPPVVTPALAHSFMPPAALPSRFQPATTDSVLGRWHAVGPTAGNPAAYVEFSTEGRWDGSDGCNGIGGNYAIGPAGELLTTSGASTDVGCDNAPLDTWIGQARRVAVSQGRLVLFDATAHEIGVLAADPKPGVASS